MRSARLALYLLPLWSCRCSEPLRPIVDAGSASVRDAGAPIAPVIADAGFAHDAGFARDAGVQADAGFFVDAGIVTQPATDGGVPQYGGPCGPVEMSPGYPAENWGEVQSQPGNGYQVTITLSFPCPVASVTVTAYDPDYPGNVMIALDASNNELARVSFVGDGVPGSVTTDTRTVTTSGNPINTVLLSPDPLDYVTYGNIAYTIP